MLKLAVIGKDVSKSDSPKMHTFIANSTGREISYDAISIPEDKFDEWIDGVISRYDGFNVTIPYKLAVMPKLKTICDDAVLFGAAVFLARLKFGFALQPVPSAALWVNPVGMALFPTLVSLVFMTKSIHCIGSTAAAILGALEPITALAIGVAVFGEAFTARIAAGIALILAAVTLVVAGKPVARAVRVRLFHKQFR